MAKKPDFDQRKSRPMTLASRLNHVVRELGGNIGDFDLKNHWETIVGPDLALQMVVDKLSSNKDGRTLTLKLTTPASAMVLSFRQRELLEKINNYYGSETIKKIVFKQ